MRLMLTNKIKTWVYHHIKYQIFFTTETSTKMSDSSNPFQDFINDPRPSTQQWNQVYNPPHFDQEDFFIDPCSFFFDKDSTINTSKREDSEESSESQSQMKPEVSEESPPPKKATKKIDNEKNRCAYISKKIVLFFVESKFKKVVKKLCRYYNCDYSDARDYYKHQLKKQFGINHLILLLTPTKEEEVKIKKVFHAFMKWFLRQKYIVYLVKNGKMGDKESYIDYKNKTLLYLETEPISQRVLNL